MTASKRRGGVMVKQVESTLKSFRAVAQSVEHGERQRKSRRRAGNM
jgi:hypothetical protein